MKFKKAIALLMSTAYVATAAPISTFAVEPESTLSEQKKEEIAPEATEPPIAATQLGDEAQATAAESQPTPDDTPSTDLPTPANPDDDTIARTHPGFRGSLQDLPNIYNDPDFLAILSEIKELAQKWKEQPLAQYLVFDGPSGKGKEFAASILRKPTSLPRFSFDGLMQSHIRNGNAIDARGVNSVAELVPRILHSNSVFKPFVRPRVLFISVKNNLESEHIRVGLIPSGVLLTSDSPYSSSLLKYFLPSGGRLTSFDHCIYTHYDALLGEFDDLISSKEVTVIYSNDDYDSPNVIDELFDATNFANDDAAKEIIDAINSHK